MPPNVVPVLDTTRAYIYCPRCEREYSQKVEMKRDGPYIKCAMGHTLEHTKAGDMHPEMIPLNVIEQPSDNAVKKEFWVHPETYNLLQQKFAGRFLVTMGTFFDNLANDSIMFINGDDARKLRELGFKTGAEMAAMAQQGKKLQEDIDRQQKIIDALKPILQAAGVALPF